MTPGNAPEKSSPPRTRFDGWRVALVGAFVLAIAGNGPDGAGLPRLIAVVVGDLPSAHADTAHFELVHSLLTGLFPALLLPFVGWATDRWRSRRMVVSGLILLAAGLMLYLTSNTFVVLYLAIAVFALGGAVGTLIPMATAVNHWFQRRRATAMAVMLLPSVVAFVLQTVFIVGSGLLMLVSPSGVLILTAALLAALAWPVSRLVKNRPEEHGQHPDGIEPTSSPPGEATPFSHPELALPDYSWREALRTRAFWLLALGGCGPGIVSFGMFIRIGLVVDHGYAVIHAGGLGLSASIIGVPFILVGGILGDRLPIGRVMFAFAILQSISFMILAFSTTLPMFYVSAALSGIGSGAGAPLIFAALGTYFGRRNYGTITGISLLILYALPQVIGILIALTSGPGGGWTAPILVTGAVSALASLAFLFLGRPKLSPSQVRELETPELMP
jgi:MFS family permease